MYSFHVRRKRNILFQQNALIPHKAGRGPWPSQGPKRRWNQSHRLSEMVIYEVCVHLYLRLLKACYCLSKSIGLNGAEGWFSFERLKSSLWARRAFYWRSIFFHKPIVVTCSISSFCQLGFLLCRRGPRRRHQTNGAWDDLREAAKHCK